jgi:type VI secretion system ImpC/EvpB family protein
VRLAGSVASFEGGDAWRYEEAAGAAPARPFEFIPPDGDLFASLFAPSPAPSEHTPTMAAQLLRARTVGEALEAIYGRREGLVKDEVAAQLNRLVGLIDHVVNEQLNALLHHSEVQRLEATWRGVKHLVDCVDAEGVTDVKVRILSVSWRELGKNFERAIEFDQSALFKKVYTEEFGMPGGSPFGLLIGDYEVSNHPNDMETMRHIAGVAAAAFCPFVAGVSPTMFGVDEFSEMAPRFDLAKPFEGKNFITWRSLRDQEDSRFVGLAMPRVLMRLPYREDGSTTHGFCFREEVSGSDHSKYLWGNAAFAFGEVVIRTYARSGWLADIRGVERDVEGGGLVTRLPADWFGTDRQGVAQKISTDFVVTEELERTLADLGFMALCHCQDTEYSAFYSNNSIQKPKKYSDVAATMNARVSAMLQYMLCTSRFAHYLKAIGRDKVGGYATAQDLQKELHNWVHEYVTPSADAKPEVKARRPLRAAKVEINEQPGSPGTFLAHFHLWPHFELDELTANVRLTTELGRPMT